MNLGDTIVALATGSAPSARAIVRASGGSSLAILAQVSRRRDGRETPVFACEIDLPFGTLPVAALTYRAPRSYTGEDAFELVMAGSPVVVRAVMDRLLACDGVRAALPGEFTARAFLAGKLSITEAEGVGRVIASRNETELRAARRVMEGELLRTCAQVADRLTTTLALTEAGIDFTDQEDVVAISPAAMENALRACIDAIDSLIGAGGSREAARDVPRVVMVGRPNAGKSTLFNALLGRTRVVVSPVAGSTVDVITEALGLGDVDVMLSDLAGLDDAKAGAHASGAAEAARRTIGQADVVVLCDPDARFDLALPETDATVIRVRTKSDLAREGVGAQGGGTRGATAREAGGAISLCALDGMNVDALRSAISDAAMASQCAESVASPRQRQELLSAREAIIPLLGAHPPAEIVAAKLRGALDALGGITGRVGVEDVLGRIFSTFCVGK